MRAEDIRFRFNPIPKKRVIYLHSRVEFPEWLGRQLPHEVVGMDGNAPQLRGFEFAYRIIVEDEIGIFMVLRVVTELFEAYLAGKLKAPKDEKS